VSGVYSPLVHGPAGLSFHQPGLFLGFAMALTTNALITLYTGESNGTLLTTLNDIASSIALNYIHWLPTQRTEMFWLTEGRTGKFSLPVLHINSVLAAYTGIDSCIKMSSNYTASVSKPTDGTAQVLKIVNLGTMAVTSHTLTGSETVSSVYTLIAAVDTAATLTAAYSALSVKRIHPCGPTDVISCITDRCDVKGYNEGGTVDLYLNRASNYAPVAVFADVGYATLPQDLQTGVAFIARNLWMRNKVIITNAAFFGTSVGSQTSTSTGSSESESTGTNDSSSKSQALTDYSGSVAGSTGAQNSTSTSDSSSTGESANNSSTPVYAMLRHLLAEPISDDAKELLSRYKLYDSWFVGSNV